MSSLLLNKISISFYLFLFLLLICISFQACHPKSLRFADNISQTKLQAFTKGRLARMVLSWDKRATESMKVSSSKAAKDHRETVESKRSNKYKKGKKQLKRSAQEFEKVSWRLPKDHKKLKDNNDVFDSDYEHARTHPPSHN